MPGLGKTHTCQWNSRFGCGDRLKWKPTPTEVARAWALFAMRLLDESDICCQLHPLKIYNLTGGLEHFLFSHIFGMIIPIWLSYFSEGFKPPTSDHVQGKYHGGFRRFPHLSWAWGSYVCRPVWGSLGVIFRQCLKRSYGHSEWGTENMICPCPKSKRRLEQTEAQFPYITIDISITF